MSEPRILTRSDSGLARAGASVSTGRVDPYLFGRLGPVRYITFHHTAGPEGHDLAQVRVLNRNIQVQHIGQGWGDIGYHFAMDNLGRIYCLRNKDAKGAHTQSFNTGNIGIVLHGNYATTSRIRQAQRESLQWLFRGGFYALFGAHEKNLTVLIHSEKFATACPGRYLAEEIQKLRKNEL